MLWNTILILIIEYVLDIKISSRGKEACFGNFNFSYIQAHSYQICRPFPRSESSCVIWHHCSKSPSRPSPDTLQGSQAQFFEMGLSVLHYRWYYEEIKVRHYLKSDNWNMSNTYPPTRSLTSLAACPFALNHTAVEEFNTLLQKQPLNPMSCKILFLLTSKPSISDSFSVVTMGDIFSSMTRYLLTFKNPSSRESSRESYRLFWRIHFIF